MKTLIFSLALVFMLLFSVTASAEGALPGVGDIISGFQVIQVRPFRLVGATAVLFRHQKTGAMLTYIANEDVNRVFDLTFLTRPVDNTGLPHVFEHATLAGSAKYPSKDLFFNLSYQTYNTYMNASTYPTMTTYPVASLSEEQLLRYADYYTDSCLHPMILTDESIYRQEAWRYRLDQPDGKLTMEGTVYSEMKGAMTLQRTASQELLRAAFPGSAAGFNHGGDPDAIPEMTFESLRAFHDLYYHPSNCMAYLYGKFEDYAAFLTLLDEAFSPYEARTFTFEDKGYTPITAAVEKEVAFPVETGSNTANASVVGYAVVCPGLREDPQRERMMDTLASLLGSSASPLAQAVRKALPSAALSVSLSALAPDDALTFSAGSVNPQDRDVFVKTVRDSLRSLAKDGFASDFIEATAASISLSSRLISDETAIGTGIIPSLAFNYSITGDPFAYLDDVESLEQITQWHEAGEYQALLSEYLVDSDLTATVVTFPDAGAKEKKDAALEEQLQAVKASMSREEIDALVAASRTAPQSDDTAALVEKLQAVTVSSLPEEVRTWDVADVQGEDGVRRMDVITGVEGLGSVQLFFDTTRVPAEDLHWMRLFIDLAGEVDTPEHTWEELTTLQTRYLYDGNIRLNTLDDGDSFHPYLRVSWTALQEDLEEGYRLIDEILTRSDFTDEARLADLISRKKAALKTALTGGIYTQLLYRAVAVTSEGMRYHTYANGFDYYRFLEEAETLIREDPAKVRDSLERVRSLILARGHAVSAFAGSEEAVSVNRPLADAFMASLPLSDAPSLPVSLPAPAAREAVVFDSSVQYNCLYADYKTLGIGHDGSLDAVTSLVSDAFLYPILRDRYGAYGVMHSAMEDEGIYIVSYRDPNVRQTFEVYESLPQLIRDLAPDQKTLDGYILSSYSGYAMPSGELSGAVSAIVNALQGKAQDRALTAMRELKSVTPETVERAASFYEVLAQRGVRSTAGSRSAIEDNAQLYDSVLRPFDNKEEGR
ncbi:MAG: insulinase family protein [Clostridia bacterium]|nr:insulinase family protein [Clostridia bacterium]